MSDQESGVREHQSFDAPARKLEAGDHRPLLQGTQAGNDSNTQELHRGTAKTLNEKEAFWTAMGRGDDLQPLIQLMSNDLEDRNDDEGALHNDNHPGGVTSKKAPTAEHVVDELMSLWSKEV